MKKQTNTLKKGLRSLWDRTPLWIQAVLIGFIVSSIGVVTWPLISTVIPMPWAFIVMCGFLWAYLKYFSGHWGPVRTRNTRAERFRSLSLPRPAWILSLFAAALIVLITQSGLVVTFRIMDFPAEKFIQEYSFIADVPSWIGWLMIIMISAVAGISEEVGFRGYMQVQLEKRYSPLLSIAIVSVVFVIIHLHQAWSGPVLLHIFLISVLFGSIAYYSGSLIPGIIAHFIMDVFNFSFWWTDLGGQFDKSTIAQTGIDSHFISWLIILVVSLAAFIFVLAVLKRKRFRG